MCKDFILFHIGIILSSYYCIERMLWNQKIDNRLYTEKWFIAIIALLLANELTKIDQRKISIRTKNDLYFYKNSRIFHFFVVKFSFNRKVISTRLSEWMKFLIFYISWQLRLENDNGINQYRRSSPLWNKFIQFLSWVDLVSISLLWIKVANEPDFILQLQIEETILSIHARI